MSLEWRRALPSLRSNRAAPAALLLLGAMMEAGFAGMLAAPPRPGATAPFLALFLVVFVLYALAVVALLPRLPGGAIWFVLGFACLFRLTLLAGVPALSTDLYRYRWDGKVTLAGLNPFLEPPADPSLAGLRDDLDTHLEHTDVRTIYPPAAQWLFASGASIGRGVLGLKGLMILADLAAIAVLHRLLVARGLSPQRLLIYAWNPLAVIEVAWSGHLEPVGVASVLLAGLAIVRKKDAAAVASLALGGLVKILPFVLLLPLLKTIRARWLALVPLLVAAACWPYRAAGWRLLDGLREYSDRWVANESLFGLVLGLVSWIDPTSALKSAIAFLRARIPGSEPLDRLYFFVYPPQIARALCAVAVIACVVAILRLRVEPLRALFLMTGALLLLSPIAHPWYLLWILPWLCLFPSGSWILLSGLAVLSYANLGAAGRLDEPYPWVRFAEYLPFYAALALEWRAARRRASSRRGAAVVASRSG
ncbi:MAG TPA: hypothetical protein VFT43_16235 [Candidatus Polarisedimenticolia bacterium]|nr:hypothetical protein [Candidatus Polarisedimenticolia bacterium]